MTFISCSNTNQGELVGVRKQTKSKKFSHPEPYGMVFVPQGCYTMGVGGQDIASGQLAQPKTVSVSPFYMDQTEITNNEYREFVYWVRDSIARRMLGEGENADAYVISQNPETGEQYDNPVLIWDEKIDWSSPDLEQLFAISDVERAYLEENDMMSFYKKKLDTRQLNYKYFWVDLHAAAKKEFSKDSEYDYKRAGLANRPQGYENRFAHIRSESINVYPDTLAWIHDYTYSFNDPLTERYFWHIAYDNYPVVGVNWNQAKAFCVWRTEKLNKYLSSQNGETLTEFRLPTEAEWEWAARGGNLNNPYPWGGPYTRSERGCFLANFKPVRGNYIADGALRTTEVACYAPNDWGLYDMAGNVAEWTNSAFDPLSYNFTWDMNPNYTYNAGESEPPTMKRKVIRGGSWKDIAYYLEVTTRAYEYQDTAKCYIGFRCVQPYLGNNKENGHSKPLKSQVY